MVVILVDAVLVSVMVLTTRKTWLHLSRLLLSRAGYKSLTS